MRTTLFGTLALGLALAFSSRSLVGCGSDSSNGDSADAGPDGFFTPTTGQGPVLPAGAPCASNNDCASGNCGDAGKVCEVGAMACAGAGTACTANNSCCSFACIGGQCSGKQCTADKGACTADGECCGGKCDAGTCTPLSTTCKTAGNPCAGNGDCCSALCQAGICSVAPSFCTQNGDACANDTDCCGGQCTKAAGASLGTCNVVVVPGGASGCTPAGQACSGATTGGSLPTCGGDCCSRSCRPYAPTGVLICQPPSGCHPTGELCQTDNDCCGVLGSPGSTKTEGGAGQSSDVHCSKAAGSTFGRCDQGKACSPAGSICRLATNSCDATDRCCAGTIQQHPLDCKQDALGIPRCTAVSDYDCKVSGPPPAGTGCASSADCCDQPCVPNPSNNPPFVCAGAACVTPGGACSTTSDCCSGSPCLLPAGSSKGTCGASGVPGGGGGSDAGTTTGGSSSGGTPPPGSTSCAQYGQTCTQTSDCCDAVPCTLGRCEFPGPN
jgi:hypothetical protein